MKKFFGKLKQKKTKWLYYVLFGVLFPLIVIGLICSFCYLPNQLASNRSSSYVNSVDFSINYANNQTAIHNENATKQEAKTAASNTITIFKDIGLSTVNVQPYVYEKTVDNLNNYYYGLHLIFASENANSLLQSYVEVNTFYDNSYLMSLDDVTKTNENTIVQQAGSDSSAVRTYLAANPIVGLKPINNNNDEYSLSQTDFDYNTISWKENNNEPYLYVNLKHNIDLTNIISNSNDQIYWWTNKAAFVNLCQNLYSLYWLKQNWWSNLENVIPSQYYTQENYQVISNLLSSFNGSSQYGELAQSLYSIIGANDYTDLRPALLPHDSQLTVPYNLITIQNIDNILFTDLPSTTQTIYNKYKSIVDQYLLAVIDKSNYTTYFTNITANHSSTLTMNMSSYVSSSSNSSNKDAQIDTMINEWKNNLLNPIISPANIKDANANTYSNVNVNPFGIWNDIANLQTSSNAYNQSQATSSSSSANNTGSTAATIALASTKNNQTSVLAFNPTAVILPFVINNLQATNITYTSKYMLTNSVSNIKAWKAIFVTIILVVLIIGIIVAVLYRFPGVIAWFIATCTLGISGLVYQNLELQTSNATLAAYLLSYIITICIFIIFLQKVMDLYHSGISFALAFEKAIKYFIVYSLDIHLLVFLFSLAFVYFTAFQLQVIGIVFAFYFVISFLINYLLAWFIFYIYATFNFALPSYCYVPLWEYKYHQQTAADVQTFVSTVNPQGHYDLSGFDSVIAIKRKLAVYLTPSKWFKISLGLITAIAIIVLLLFMIWSIFVYKINGVYHYPTLNASTSYNITGNYLFNQLLFAIFIGTAFSTCYMLLRFGKGILFFITNCLACYVIVCFFVLCKITQDVNNIEGLGLGILSATFINSYLNSLCCHLFKFKVENTTKEAWNIMVNVIINQWRTYLIITSVAVLSMILNYIFNSTDLFLLNLMNIVPYFFIWFISITFVPVIRLIYVIFKNVFTKVEGNIKFKNYDTVQEEIVQGINEFKVNKREDYIYE